MKQKKTILSFLLVFVLMLGLIGNVMGANQRVMVNLDNKPIEFSQSDGIPFIDENNRTLVPLRKVMESFGCIVEWDQNSKTAYVVKDGVVVTITIGQRYIRVNGMSQSIDTCAVIQNARTYLPIRAVLEAFGATVDWDSVSRTVLVTSPAAQEVPTAKDGKDGADGKDGKNGADGKDGVNGKDGISVSNAKINETGNLILTLSDGTTIDAGTVATNQSDYKTFEDYEVGTKFYLEYPSGEFDILFTSNGTQYTIHFSEVYYELTAKRTLDDPEAWNGHFFVPYVVNFHIQGSTSPNLAGKSFYIVFNDTDTYTSIGYNFTVADDGSFQSDLLQGIGDNHFPWYAPRTLCLERFG